ncbi:MAG: class I SAM-dependent methyltransferase [Deltaproteobacteria bacterium]|nr:class I SAM-dependent methyltransferase [Deltaproteobacteria bacterium]
MAIAKERLGENSLIPNWTWYDHLARYHFAAQFVKDKILLDCACGAGVGTEIFAKEGAKEIIGVDVSDAALEQARQRTTPFNCTFKKGDATHLPVKDRSVDVYISLETIEHINEVDSYLSEAKRVLKDDGVFICSTPNRRVSNPGKTLDDKPWNRYHVREYDHKEFAGLLSRSFPLIEWHGLNPNSIKKTSLLNAIGAHTPFHFALRINQVYKLMNMFFDRPAYHRVVPWDHKWDYEFFIAVCRFYERST